MPVPEHLEALIGGILAAYRHPLDYQKRWKGSLPAPFQPVLRLAAGKALPGLETLCRRWQTTPEELRRAAVFFIEQACLEGEEDPHRILGLSPPAAPSQIQTHYHLLMLVFHPDRVEATANWRDVYAARVNTAYQQLRRTAGQRVDARSHAPPSVSTRRFVARPPRRRRAPPSNPLSFPLSFLVQRFPRLVRHLPHIILGGGAAVALGLVLHLYLSRVGGEASTAREAEAPAAATASSLDLLGGMPLANKAVFDSERGTAEGSKKAVSPLPESLRQEKPADQKKTERPVKQQPSAPESKKETKHNAPSPATSASASAMPSASDTNNHPAPVTADSRPESSPVSPSRVEAAKSTVKEPAAPPLAQAKRQRLLRRFVTAYQAGDLKSFLALFSADIRTNDYAGKAALREDYARFFAATQSRELELKEVQWHVTGGTDEGKGRYVVRVDKPDGTVESQGRIHFQVQERAGERVITGFFNSVENE